MKRRNNMVYKGTEMVEVIKILSLEDEIEDHFIELHKCADEPAFYATCCCDEDWFYAFYIENNSDYERVKFSIMNAVFECDDMNDLLETLRETFEDGFSDILMRENCKDCHCEDKCSNCQCE
jgi:hypothetical protein